MEFIQPWKTTIGSTMLEIDKDTATLITTEMLTFGYGSDGGERVKDLEIPDDYPFAKDIVREEDEERLRSDCDDHPHLKHETVLHAGDRITEIHTPAAYAFRRDVIIPKVKEYIQTCFPDTVNLDNLHATSWISYSADNQGIRYHTHDSSLLTAVFYLTAGNTELIMDDPRGNARRGFDVPVRKKFFPRVDYKPVDGELVIVPSYVPHYVLPCPGAFRMVIVTDFIF